MADTTTDNTDGKNLLGSPPDAQPAPAAPGDGFWTWATPSAMAVGACVAAVVCIVFGAPVALIVAAVVAAFALVAAAVYKSAQAAADAIVEGVNGISEALPLGVLPKLDKASITKGIVWLFWLVIAIVALLLFLARRARVKGSK